jgi:hypothetical protein
MECTPQLSTSLLNTAGTWKGVSEYTRAIPGLRCTGALLQTLQQAVSRASTH